MDDACVWAERASFNFLDGLDSVDTLFQLMTILEEDLAQALKQTSREATILLYAPVLDPLHA